MHGINWCFRFSDCTELEEYNCPPIKPEEFHWYFCPLEPEINNLIQLKYYENYVHYGDQDVVDKKESINAE
jgi:hypothetical protein